jgi:hypothetical protein
MTMPEFWNKVLLYSYKDLVSVHGFKGYSILKTIVSVKQESRHTAILFGNFSATISRTKGTGLAFWLKAQS